MASVVALVATALTGATATPAAAANCQFTNYVSRYPRAVDLWARSYCYSGSGYVQIKVWCTDGYGTTWTTLGPRVWSDSPDDYSQKGCSNSTITAFIYRIETLRSS